MASIANKIILGTVQFGLPYGINNSGGKTNEKEAFAILEYAQHAGIRILDTAESYGNAQEVIGNFHVWHPHFDIISKFKLESADLSSSLVNSLETLGVKSLYAYYFHSFEEYKKNPGVLKDLLKLKEKKLVERIGVSVYSNEELIETAVDPFVDLIQVPFNCFDNFSRRGEALKAAKGNGKEIHARSIFLQGLFFMQIDELPVNLASFKRYLPELYTICDHFGISMTELALRYAWSYTQPSFGALIDYLVVGVDSARHLVSNLDVPGEKLNEEIIFRVNEIRISESNLLSPVNWK